MIDPVDKGAMAPAFAVLLHALQAELTAFDFCAVMRRVEAQHPRLPRLGKALRPRDEPLRLGQDAELDFAVSELSSLRIGAAGRPRLGQRFFGLFGPMGPLPLHFTEYVRERERHHADAAPARFADVLHHRATLLFYRAWAQSQPAVHLDRRDDDAYSRWVGSFIGVGHAETEGSRVIGADAKRFRAAILARHTRSAEGMAKLLEGWFRVPVRLESYVGHWLATREEDFTRLTRPNDARPRNRLGRDAVAGDRVWDRQFKFRLHLGPLTLAQYRRFLPGSRALAEMSAWVREYAGTGYAFDSVQWLSGAEVPRLALGTRRHQPPSQLGWTTWLGTRAPHQDRFDLRLRPAAAPAH